MKTGVNGEIFGKAVTFFAATEEIWEERLTVGVSFQEVMSSVVN
jgi:hypothetical protein